MSETIARDDWVKDVLGIDVSAGNGGGDGGAGEKHQKQAKGGLGRVGLKTKGKADKGAGGTPKDTDLVAKLKTLAEEAAKLKDFGFNTKQMLADHADFAKRGVAAEALTDTIAQAKALTAVKNGVDEALEHAKALSTSLAKAMSGKKGNPDAAQKSAIYKEAIEDLYGLKIEVPKGMKNTNFDKVFDMLGTLPKKDTKQDMMKKLIYSEKKEDKGSGAYYNGQGKIEMGDFGKAKGKEVYEIDGKKIPANSFNVTTLHEVGHAVDDKHGIMTKNGAKAGCGGWQRESVAKATAAFLPDLKRAVKQATGVPDPDLSAVISAALQNGTTAQPAGIADMKTWKPILKYLVDNCLKVRSDADPWFETSPLVIGGRVYQEAYAGQWWSYDPAARASTKVNDYQWRSPAEWFAEVYAISWLAKKKPPTGVDASVAEYMYQA